MNKYTTLAIAAMMVMMAVPATMAEPGNYDDKKSITGPSSVRIQGIGSAGLGICFLDPTFPLACDPAPGATGGLGFANFDVSTLTGATEGVRFWAEWTGGFFSPVQGGFFISPCTDRDDDGGCFSTDAWDDDSGDATPGSRAVTGDAASDGEAYDDIFGPYGYSNDGLIQAAPCDKDTKDCGDPTAAESSFCIKADTAFQDIAENGLTENLERIPDNEYDDVTVFLGVWGGSLAEPGKVGAGISAGTYDVYVEYTGSGCTIPLR